MKPKHLIKKLALNKNTVADLARKELFHVQAGKDLPVTDHSCFVTCVSDCVCPTDHSCPITPFPCQTI